MALTAKDVAEITRLLEESSFDELYLELDGVKLTLRRGAAGPALGASAPHASPSAPRAMPAQAPAQTPSRDENSGLAPGASALPPESSGSAAAAPARASAARASAPASARASPVAGAADVPAPLLGTFYRAPKPGAPPFIEVGSIVEEDTIVGIIEVMKLMNTVRAGVRGRVTEILAGDGVLVEYGETLLRVGRTS